MLPTLVQRLLSDLTHAVEECIQNAFDLARISKDAIANGILNLPLSWDLLNRIVIRFWRASKLPSVTCGLSLTSENWANQCYGSTIYYSPLGAVGVDVRRNDELLHTGMAYVPFYLHSASVGVYLKPPEICHRGFVLIKIMCSKSVSFRCILLRGSSRWRKTPLLRHYSWMRQWK